MDQDTRTFSSDPGEKREIDFSYNCNFKKDHNRRENQWTRIHFKIISEKFILKFSLLKVCKIIMSDLFDPNIIILLIIAISIVTFGAKFSIKPLLINNEE